MVHIQSITYRTVLNSHAQFTTEFIVTLQDGSQGSAAPSQGETISIYEDRKVSIDPQTIIDTITNDGMLEKELNQVDFDAYLQQHIGLFGRNNSYGLSEAFFSATSKTHSMFELFGRPKGKLTPPRISLNILNGGWHAYTNPVLSDFHEFMLVAKSSDIAEVIGEHNEIQRVVRERQRTQDKTVVSGNPVNCFSTRDNRPVVEFLLDVVSTLGYNGKYDLMIDSSAGDLWDGQGYKLSVTDGQVYTSEQFVDYWLDMIRQYDLRFLEDPFGEKDFAGWQHLMAAQQGRYVIGDNLYTSSAERIREGAEKGIANAAVIKPNMAGTVTDVRRALQATHETGQVSITSHRSISTESTFVSLLSCMDGAQFIKIGPLLTDYSSILRLNEIIRLTEESYAR